LLARCHAGIAGVALSAGAYRIARRIDAAIPASRMMLKNALIPNGNGGQIHAHHRSATRLVGRGSADLPGADLGGDQDAGVTAIG
jgi:hypothetical protein